MPAQTKTTSIRSLLDHNMGGRLAANLSEWRAAGESFETIGRRLAADHAVNVSASTVHRWCTELEVAS